MFRVRCNRTRFKAFVRWSIHISISDGSESIYSHLVKLKCLSCLSKEGKNAFHLNGLESELHSGCPWHPQFICQIHQTVNRVAVEPAVAFLWQPRGCFVKQLLTLDADIVWLSCMAWLRCMTQNYQCAVAMVIGVNTERMACSDACFSLL